jgi:hypothetical protein
MSRRAVRAWSGRFKTAQFKSGRLKFPEGLNMLNRFSSFSLASILAAFAALLILPACSINVDKSANGKDKKVDINTFAGGIHVSKQADPSDTGLTVYPGARLKPEDSSGDDKSANVNISGFGYGIKVVALDYQSDDAPAKVIAFYKDQLKKYGKVLECHTSKGNWNINMGKRDSNELTCQGTGGPDTELKVGQQDSQHIVAVRPEGNGSSFALVYVRTHGKDSDI